MNDTESPSAMSRKDRLERLGVSLDRGAQASRRIVKIRGRASQIQETLDRVSNTASAILSALRPSNQPKSLDSGQNRVPFELPLLDNHIEPFGLPDLHPQSYPTPSATGNTESLTTDLDIHGGPPIQEDLSQLFGGDVDIFDTLGDMSFGFDDFTAL